MNYGENNVLPLICLMLADFVLYGRPFYVFKIRPPSRLRPFRSLRQTLSGNFPSFFFKKKKKYIKSVVLLFSLAPLATTTTTCYAIARTWHLCVEVCVVIFRSRRLRESRCSFKSSFSDLKKKQQRSRDDVHLPAVFFHWL